MRETCTDRESRFSEISVQFWGSPASIGKLKLSISTAEILTYEYVAFARIYFPSSALLTFSEGLPVSSRPQHYIHSPAVFSGFEMATSLPRALDG